ncbi:trehalase family glycosidase [Brevundimonas sp. DWR2-3-1b1]|uniref:trehalase family glycosidase n=1 Tax=unclassified Brevundimonas TaxID=2622653 RepID=UPI003CE9BA76
MKRLRLECTKRSLCRPHGWRDRGGAVTRISAAHRSKAQTEDLVDCVYREPGKMLEKYDIEDQRLGGGEYPIQDGLGWTNGVTRALLERQRGQ